MWKLNELYYENDEWFLKIKEYKNDLLQLHIPSQKIENIPDIFEFIQVNACKLDKLYTYGLLKRELLVSDSSVSNGIAQIHQLYSLFNKKILPLQIFVDANIDNILSYLKNIRNTNLIPYFLNIKLKKNNFSKSTLYKNISPYDDYIEWYGSFKNIGSFTYNGQTIEVTENNILSYLKDSNQDLRRKTYKNVEHFLHDISHQAAFHLNTHIQLNNAHAINKGWKNSYELFVSNSLMGNESVNIIKKAKGNVSELNHKIIKFKNSTFSSTEFSYSDMYFLPGESTRKISLDEAKYIILKAFTKLGNEFETITQKALYENWITFEKSENKHAGQRTYSSFHSHPYIKVNWDNRIDDLFDLAHEIAGAVGQYFASKSTYFLYSELSILKTEFISILGTQVLCEFLLDNPDIIGDKRLVISRTVDFFKDIFVLPFEFCCVENKLYEEATKGRLTQTQISDIWYSMVSNFHDTPEFQPMKLNKYNWVRHDHLYLDGYDYKYVEAFLLSFKYHREKINHNINELVPLLSQGEMISDEYFFNKLIGDINIESDLNKTIFEITKFIQEKKF